MSEEEKKAVEILNSWYSYNKKNRNKLLEADKIIKVQETTLNLIENQQKELEHYKRLAEMNLKDSEEFKKNMCEHRCILNNQIMELTEELNNLKEIEKSHKEENGKLRVEYEKVYEDNLTLANELEQEKASNKFDKGLYGLLMKEKEKNKELEEKLKIAKQLYNDACVCIATDCVEKDKIKDMMKYREFELQQEYKEFEEDVEWRTYKKILEDK